LVVISNLINILRAIATEQSLTGGGIVAAAISAVLSITLLLSMAWYLRRTYTDRAPAVLVFGTFALAGLFRSFGLLGGASVGLLANSANPLGRTLQSILVTVLLLSLVAFVSNGLAHQQQLIRQLHEEANRLTQLRSNARAELRSTRREVDRLVRETVAPALTTIAGRIASAASAHPDPAELHQLAASVRGEASMAVRQLGRALVAQPKPAEQTPPNHQGEAVLRLRRRSLIDVAATVRPFQPLLTSGLIGLSMVGSLINRFGPAGLALTAAAMAVNSVLLLGAQRIHSVGGRRSRSARITSWIALTVACGMLTGLVVANPLQFATDRQTVVASVVAVTIAELVFVGLIGLVAAAMIQLDRTTRSLQATVSSIDIETSGLRDAQTAIRRSVGVALHGQVQGRLVADSVRIDLAAEALERDPTDPSLEVDLRVVLTEVQADFQRLEEELDSLSTRADGLTGLPDLLAAISAEWRGVVAIEYSLDHAVTEGKYAELAPVIAEIVREGVVNASKHGNASAVDAQVSVIEGAVEVVVEDNGSGTNFRGAASDSRDPVAARLNELLESDYEVRLVNTVRSGARLQVRIPLGD